MKRLISASPLPVLALTLVIGIVCGKLLERPPMQAAQSAVVWEYCAIIGIAPLTPGYRATIYYFKPDGIREENGIPSSNQEGALGRAVWQLGVDGWELVSAGAQLPGLSYGTQVMFYKRLKR